MVILPASYHSIEEYTDDLVDFLDTPLVHQITGGIHVNDALIHNGWEALPPDWTAWWSSLPDHRIAQQDLIDSIDEKAANPAIHPPQEVQSQGRADEQIPQAAPNNDTGHRPESLTKWLNTLSSLALPRAQRRPEDETNPRLTLPPALTSTHGTGMKRAKKMAEVATAAAHIHRACRQAGIRHVIDMGSGQGHLSRALAFLFPGLRVLAVDGSASQIAGSAAAAAALGVGGDRLTHLVRHVEYYHHHRHGRRGAGGGEDSPAGSGQREELVAEVAAWAGGGRERCMLVGLHACGRLSEHMLRLFTALPFVASLAAVGCCFNHMILPPATSAGGCPDDDGGFPISARLRERRVVLSATALMTGCQAPNNWPRVDVQQQVGGEGRHGGSSVYSKRHFYRALLERLFVDKGIAFDDGPVCWPGMSKGDLASFAAFATRAMRFLGVSEDRISQDEMIAYEERYRDSEGRVAILWTLSVLCCKVVESVIALDRYWSLVEHGAKNVDIVPIFDYSISPRNLMMVADKG